MYQTGEPIAEAGRYSSPMETKLRGTGIALLGVLAATAAPAEVEVTPFLGYVGGGGFDTREGDLEIKPNANLGLVVSLRTRHDGLVEFLWHQWRR